MLKKGQFQKTENNYGPNLLGEKIKEPSVNDHWELFKIILLDAQKATIGKEGRFA